MNTTIENLNEFLTAVSELTIKFGIEIAGCRCCGSPYLISDSFNGKFVDALSWNEELRHYEVDISTVRQLN